MNEMRLFSIDRPRSEQAQIRENQRNTREDGDTGDGYVVPEGHAHPNPIDRPNHHGRANTHIRGHELPSQEELDDRRKRMEEMGRNIRSRSGPGSLEGTD